MGWILDAFSPMFAKGVLPNIYSAVKVKHVKRWILLQASVCHQILFIASLTDAIHLFISGKCPTKDKLTRVNFSTGQVREHKSYEVEQWVKNEQMSTPV